MFLAGCLGCPRKPGDCIASGVGKLLRSIEEMKHTTASVPNNSDARVDLLERNND